jgi:hypothetical protein
MNPEKIKAALDAIEKGDEAAALALLKELIAEAAGGEAPADKPEGEALAESPEAPAPKPGEEEEKAALSALKKLTGKDGLGEAVVALSALFADVAKIKTDAAVLELSSRRELVGELVKLGVELPATAWTGKPEDRNPVKRLLDEPIDDLRKRVAALSAAKPKPKGPTAPETGTGEASDVALEVSKLSAGTLARIKEKGLTPEQFIARRSAAVRRSA